MRPEDIKVALVAIAKDEDDYLKEWVDYHLKVGFSDIFVYQNDWRYERGDISSDKMHFMVADGQYMQMRVYNDFIRDFHDDYDFAAFLDVDEFLWLRDCRNIKEFLAERFDMPAMFVNWRLFGDSGLDGVHDGDYSVIRRFTHCAYELDPLGKNILNLRFAHLHGLHFWNPHIVMSQNHAQCTIPDPTGKRTTVMGTIPDNDIDEPCEIYHFKAKTLQERILRQYMKCPPCLRRMDVTHTDIDAFMREFGKDNRNDVENTNLVKIMENTVK